MTSIVLSKLKNDEFYNATVKYNNYRNNYCQKVRQTVIFLAKNFCQY